MAPQRGLRFNCRIISALISFLVFVLVSAAPLSGQNSNPFPWPDPVTHAPANPANGNATAPSYQPYPSYPAVYDPTAVNRFPATGGTVPGPAPNPMLNPTWDQTQRFIENHPALKNLDPITKMTLVYGGTGSSAILNSQYLNNGQPNPFYQNGQVVPNWYLPTTWSSRQMNWIGVQPNGFLPSASPTSYSWSSGTTPYNPTTYTPTYRPPVYQPPTVSTPNRDTTRTTNLSPIQSQIAATNSRFTPLLARDASSVAKIASDREHALAVSETAGDKVGQMINHTALAQLFVQQGNFTQALLHVSAAEPMVKTAGDPRLRVDLLRAKSAAHMQAGEFEAALADNREIAPILKSLSDDDGWAETFLSSAWAFQSLGDIQKAIGCYDAAFNLFSRTGDKDGQVRARIGIGSLYQYVGQYDKAVGQYRAALPSASKIQQARIYASNADLLQALGYPLAALDHYKKAQSLLVPGIDSSFEVTILTGIGRSLMMMRAFKDAEKSLAQARSLVEGTSNTPAKAGVIASAGELQYWMAISSPMANAPPRFKQALKNYDEALPLMRGIGDRAGEIGVLTNSGLVYDAKGKSKEALSYYLQALDKMEDLQTQARLEEFRSNIAGQSAALYARAIQLEVETHNAEAAFALSERARARLLLDQLGNARIDDINQASPEFMAKEEQLRRENITLERQLGQELSRPGPELNSEKIRVLQSRVVAVRSSYESLFNQLKLSNPKYAAFLSIAPMTVEMAQRRLDPETTIVSYLTAPYQTIVFVLTKTSLRMKKLNIGEADLIHEISTFRDFASDDEVSPSLRILYKELIAPIHSEIKTSKLIFVPHGVLHELPFAALSSDGHHFLSDDYSISYLPSVSALSYLHPKVSSSVPQALILVSNQEEGSPLLTSADDEGKSVASFFGTKPLLGKEATASVVRKDAANYDIVHLVAHFEINRKNPMASRILLSRGEKGDDNPLDLTGVYGLSLRKTDLVVLSGCQSQSGKRTRGDDIIGLSQAFLYAGSPSVVASLWSVDDEATKLLMVAFYTHLRQGLSKVDALRAAQVEVRQKYPSPFYWAGFVLMGDPGQAGPSNLLAISTN
jgi:CHAT domain-containing protein